MRVLRLHGVRFMPTLCGGSCNQINILHVWPGVIRAWAGPGRVGSGRVGSGLFGQILLIIDFD